MHMAVKIQIRNDEADIWQAVNPILAEGELAIEIDTRKFKIGDGVTAWNALPAATQGETGKSIEIDWSGTQLGVRVEGETSYQYVDLKGDKGDTGDTGATGQQGIPGKNLEFTWDGTQLGVRQQGENNYSYVDLKGDKGDTGSPGIIIQDTQPENSDVIWVDTSEPSFDIEDMIGDITALQSARIYEGIVKPTNTRFWYDGSDNSGVVRK